MARCGWLVVLLLAGFPLPGQQGRKALEPLLKEINARLAAMSQQFEGLASEALRVFRSPLPRDKALALDHEARLRPWVGVFPKRFAELVRKESSALARKRLLAVVLQAGEERSAPSLEALLGGQGSPELKALVAACLGKLGQASSRGPIRKLLMHHPGPKLLAACILALGRLHDPSLKQLASTHLLEADRGVRKASLEALALTASGSRKVLGILLERARNEEDLEVRAAAVQSLWAFPNNYEALRFLGEILKTPHKKLQQAALKALALAGSKNDLSRGALLAFISRGTAVSLPLREEAARLLHRFGSLQGIKLLVRRDRELANRSPRKLEPQRRVADHYYQLGAWGEALTWYQRALNLDRRRSLLHVGMARCYALLGRFPQARKALLEARYKDFSPFRDDPDFAEMRRQPAYKRLFERGQGSPRH